MFDITTLFKSFLGANSAKGFVSYFADSYSAEAGWHVYIIKGGPGTGKSSMMKQLAAYFAEKGSQVELCPCSSDPDSLDAVIFWDKKTVIMDGTAPHTVDPSYPGVCEKIINLCDCWEDSAFLGKEQEIIKLTRENKKLHAHASRYIAAAGSLYEQSRNIALKFTDTEKVKRTAAKICRKMLNRAHAAGEEKRFLSGITPKGLLFLKQSIAPHYKTVIAVEDSIGAASSTFLAEVRRQCLAAGQRIITCHNTLEPTIIDHILLPDSSIAFCTENRYTHPDGVTRRIHARRFTDTVALAERRQTLSFNRRASEELLREAVRIIAEAKRTHDMLEEYYISAMDFGRVGEITTRIAAEIENR